MSSWKSTIKKVAPEVKEKSWKDTVVEAPIDPSEYEPGNSALQDLAEAIPDMLVSAPQGVTTWSDEIMAGIPAMLEKVGGSKEPYMDIYDKYHEPVVNKISAARERSPVASRGAEIGAGIGSAFLPGIGAGKLGGAGGMIARGGLEGLGSATDKLSLEGAVSTGVGAGIGLGGALISGGVKKLTTANPNEIRANVLGAGSSEFKEIGIKEREEIAKSLKDMGLFSNTKVEFDPKTLKFIPKGKSLENLEKPARDKILSRLQEASSKVDEEKLKILGQKVNDTVDLDQIESTLSDVVKKFSKKGSGMDARANEAEEIKAEILNDILSDMEEQGLSDSTIGLIEQAKRRISENVGNYGKNPLLQKTPNQAQIYQSMYSAINKKLRMLLGDTRYSQLNDAQQKFLTAQADLAKSMASDAATRQAAGWGGWTNRMLNAVAGSDETRLGLASFVDKMNMPGVRALKTPLRLGAEEAPFQAIREIRNDIPLVPAPEELPPTQGYNFENVKPAFPMGVPPKGSFISPKQLLKYRIPRTTDGILQNKEMVLAKIAQSGVPSEMYDTVAYALNENPEKIKDIAPVIMMQFPTLFEDSPYKIFDNKIIDPNDRARMADSLSKDDNLNSIQKAKMISKINKTGEVPKLI